VGNPKITKMKQFIFILITFLILTNVSGQVTELNFSLNSGLYSYYGISAESATSINYDDQTKSGYTNNPYGSKVGLCYGFSLNIKRITKSNFIYGFDFGYESLRSNVSIDKISGVTSFKLMAYEIGATGQTYLINNNLNLNPFIGYRFLTRNIPIDLAGGFDYGYILKSRESGEARATNGMNYTTSMDRKDISFDIRPRIQFSTDYKKIGIYIGYSFGLINYMMFYKSDAVNEVYSRIIRFGITYQIK
jgi:hypothetical protein